MSPQCLHFDTADHTTQGLCTLLDLLRLVFTQSLVEDCNDTILTHDNWKTQEHLLFDSMVILKTNDIY